MSNFRHEIYMARRYLRGGGPFGISIATFISTLGVAVGVLALIVVRAVFTGYKEEVRAQILGGRSHVEVLHDQGEEDVIGIYDYQPIIKKVEAVPGVEAVSPVYQVRAAVVADGRAAALILQGIVPDRLAEATIYGERMKEGKLSYLGNRPYMEALTRLVVGEGAAPLPGIVLGEKIAQNLYVVPGEVVTVVDPVGGVGPSGVIPKSQRFILVGVFATNWAEYDYTFGFADLGDVQRIFDDARDPADLRVTRLDVKVDDFMQADVAARRIEKALGPGFHCRDWKEANMTFFDALTLEKYAMSVILLFIVLVAAFNNISTLVMLVKEKKKEIAIMKAMGASNPSVRRLFVLMGGIIGFVGATLGLVVGLAICLAQEHWRLIKLPASVYGIDHLPINIVPWEVAVVYVAAVAISLLSTAHPSGQAARLPTAEALRAE